jgi:hypothetical protein
LEGLRMSDVLSHAIEEIERCQLPDLGTAITKALAVMKALQCVLDPPHALGLEHALANLDVSALVDDEGWPQIRYTLGDQP